MCRRKDGSCSGLQETVTISLLWLDSAAALYVFVELKAHIRSGLMQTHVGHQSGECSWLIKDLVAQWGEKVVSAAWKLWCGLLYSSHIRHVTLHYERSDDTVSSAHLYSGKRTVNRVYWSQTAQLAVLVVYLYYQFNTQSPASPSLQAVQSCYLCHSD